MAFRFVNILSSSRIISTMSIRPQASTKNVTSAWAQSSEEMSLLHTRLVKPDFMVSKSFSSAASLSRNGRNIGICNVIAVGYLLLLAIIPGFGITTSMFTKLLKSDAVLRAARKSLLLSSALSFLARKVSVPDLSPAC